MKIIFNLILVLFISTSAFSNSTNNFMSLNQINDDYKTENVLKIGIDMWLTSIKGCKFHIVGNYNTWSGSFSGSVTASGPGDCPHDTWQFGIAISDTGETTLYGENPFIDELKSDPKLLNELVRHLQTA